MGKDAGHLVSEGSQLSISIVHLQSLKLHSLLSPRAFEVVT